VNTHTPNHPSHVHPQGDNTYATRFPRLLESHAGSADQDSDHLVCVSFGAGILFADALNSIKLGGYPLGFWFAHQGSIYIFIALIFYYAKKMGDIDRQFDVHED
jgi:putative solute:sodium symporter small subunit